MPTDRCARPLKCGEMVRLGKKHVKGVYCSLDKSDRMKELGRVRHRGCRWIPFTPLAVSAATTRHTTPSRLFARPVPHGRSADDPGREVVRAGGGGAVGGC